ncbi:MAG: GNAT family N-acetyltransferase [Clostridia bacterium]|nr:GNAT family N-acetyltransferase [Clostridia bacterium]
MNDCLIKRIEPNEYDFILDLNKANEEMLLPLNREKLDFFSENAELFLIAYVDGTPAGFLIALREGLEEYDIACYKWFCKRYSEFLYVDRVVVAERFRRNGLALRLYRAVFSEAREFGIDILAASVTASPYNGVSMRLHKELGFFEVGELSVRGGTVKVSMLASAVQSTEEQRINEKLYFFYISLTCGLISFEDYCEQLNALFLADEGQSEILLELQLCTRDPKDTAGALKVYLLDKTAQLDMHKVAALIFAEAERQYSEDTDELIKLTRKMYEVYKLLPYSAWYEEPFIRLAAIDEYWDWDGKADCIEELKYLFNYYKN